MRRILRDVRHEELIKSLTTGDAAIFGEIWRLMLFAAALGIKSGRKRAPLGKSDSGKAIPDNYFSAPCWPGFLYLIGVADSEDSGCLKGTDENSDALITAFEEYANIGLEILHERIGISSAPLDGILSLMLESVTPPIEPPTLDGLI